MADPEPASEEVDLASAADLQLGGVLIQPSSLRLARGEREARIEPRVMRVLITLARAGGRTVSRDQLIDACWGGRVVSDDAVSRIIAKARLAAKAFDPMPFTIETLPRVGFRLVEHAADDAPEDDAPQDTSPTSSRSGLTPRGRHAAGLAAGLALVLALAGVWTLVSGGSQSPQAGNGRVEIMTVRPLQDDADLEALGASMTDAAESFLPGRAIAMDISSPAGAGDAEFRIAGSITREGERLLATGQIIDRASGLVLWSGQAERPAARAALIEVAYGSLVGSVLLCGIEQRRTAQRTLSGEDLSLVFKVCEALNLRQRDPLEPANELVRAAPDLALSHAMLSASILNDLEGRIPSPAEMDAGQEKSRAAAMRALEIMRDHPIANLTLARIARSRGRFEEAEREFEKAVAYDPELAPTLMLYISFLRDVGRLREAATLAERTARMTDPRTIGSAFFLAFLQAMADNLDGAMASIERSKAFGQSMDDSASFTISVWWKDPTDALRELPTFSRQGISDRGRACFTRVLGALSRHEPLPYMPDSCADLSVDWQIRLLSRLGLVDNAYALFEASNSEARRSNMFLFYPEMKAFRQDPRFIPLTRRIGLYDYWRDTGRWPDFCNEPDLPYDCRTE